MIADELGHGAALESDLAASLPQGEKKYGRPGCHRGLPQKKQMPALVFLADNDLLIHVAVARLFLLDNRLAAVAVDILLDDCGIFAAAAIGTLMMRAAAVASMIARMGASPLC
jgi:hypothetical protein